MSWGGYESIAVPPFMTFGDGADEKELNRIGITRQLVRLHVGLENPEDLIEDLRRGLDRI